jgi:hypothetical protein
MMASEVEKRAPTHYLKVPCRMYAELADAAPAKSMGVSTKERSADG